MTLIQYTVAAITFPGSLCMNLGGRWKVFGVACGVVAGPLWMLSELGANQGGMLFSSLMIWLTYFVGVAKELRARSQTRVDRRVTELFGRRLEPRVTGKAIDFHGEVIPGLAEALNKEGTR